MSKKYAGALIMGGLVIAIEFAEVTMLAQWAIVKLSIWPAVVMVVMGAMKFMFAFAVVYMAWKRQGVVQ